MKKIVVLILVSFCLIESNAQYSLRVVVKNKINKETLVRITVSEGKENLSISMDDGIVTIKKLTAGNHTLTFKYVGYKSYDTTISIPQTTHFTVFLEPVENALEEVTVVSSTRSNQKIENSTMKVEVLDKTEMDEETTIKPANIAGLLNDLSGVQIQQSSQVSGNANVRLQGLGGGYTQVVRDGMPLFEGFSGGFGILQIPPLDLKQIELIKGSASTLYGGGAIGGLVNVISKKPSYEQEGILTLNQTSLQESNLNAYLAKRNKTIGYNFFCGLTNQHARDVNNDGLSDVPKLSSAVIHPRFFFYPSTKTSIAVGYTGTFETRKGGDMQVLDGQEDSIHQFYERDKSNRHTGDIIIEQQLGKGSKLEIKGSLSSFARSIRTNTHYFKGNQMNYFSEASLFIPKGKYSWVMGINAIGDRFKILPSDPVSLKGFDNNTIGAFTQVTAKLGDATTVEAGIRADHHTQYGDFLLPRLALFHRFNEHWATRWGIGFGYKTPNPLVEQNEDYKIEQLQPLPANIAPEKSVGYNAEVNYKLKLDGESSIFINQAFFLTQINNPVIATEMANNEVVFSNAGSNITSKGSDTYIKILLDEWELYAGYTYTDAERNYLSQQKFMPLTPRNHFSFIGTYEIEGEWKFGLEASYSDGQYRDGYTKTTGYPIFAALVEKEFAHHISLVLNCEDLLNFQQGKEESLYTGTITNPTFKPVWAPTDGRVINLSLRWNWAMK